MAVQLRIPYGVAGRQHIVLDDAGCLVAKGQVSNVVAGVTRTAAKSAIGSYLVRLSVSGLCSGTIILTPASLLLLVLGPQFACQFLHLTCQSVQSRCQAETTIHPTRVAHPARKLAGSLLRHLLPKLLSN